MQKIFSKELRFKVKNGVEFPEWEKKSLSHLAKILHGKDQKLSAHTRQPFSGDIMNSDV